MIHEEICTYEVCKLAKEKGFPLRKVIKQDGRAFFYELPQSHPDWANCDAWYIPTQSLLQRWLREEKGVIVYPFPMYMRWHWGVKIIDKPFWHNVANKPLDDFTTYEEAMEAGLKYALENLV